MSVCIVFDSSTLLLGGFLEALERHRVGEVDPLVLLELRDDQLSAAGRSRRRRLGVTLVLFTKTPSASSSTEMSVPPPRSKTAIFSSFFFSRP